MFILGIIAAVQILLLFLIWAALLELLDLVERPAAADRSPADAVHNLELQTMRSMLEAARISDGEVLERRERRL